MNSVPAQDRAALLAQAAEINWFHAIDFGEAQSCGRFSRGAQNRSLFGAMDLLSHIDLKGLDCIDIGAADGLMAFGMANRGAARVVATDARPRDKHPAIGLAARLLNAPVDIRYETRLTDLAHVFEPHAFDVAVCAGVMYHLLNPMEAVVEPRRLLKRGGLLVFQTYHHADAEGAVLEVNSVTGRVDNTNTYFVPSRAAVLGMLELAGFQVLATRTGANHPFLTVLARALNLGEVPGVSEMTQRQHAQGVGGIVSRIRGPRSAATYTGPRDHAHIDSAEYRPDFPPHPNTITRPVGASHLAAIRA